jgi:outer membrane protein assembly factor BamE (lipoprotein component of BamABCDE complex)
MKLYTVIAFLGFALLTGCATQPAPVAVIPARQAEIQKITVGAAQTLQIGMGGAEVVSALGTPNIVTTDKEGLETWVYDKIANEYEFVSVQENGWAFNPRQRSSGVEVRSQRTLIVVVKFDKDRKIANVQYRQTAY